MAWNEKIWHEKQKNTHNISKTWNYIRIIKCTIKILIKKTLLSNIKALILEIQKLYKYVYKSSSSYLNIVFDSDYYITNTIIYF